MTDYRTMADAERRTGTDRTAALTAVAVTAVLLLTLAWAQDPPRTGASTSTEESTAAQEPAPADTDEPEGPVPAPLPERIDLGRPAQVPRLPVPRRQESREESAGEAAGTGPAPSDEPGEPSEEELLLDPEFAEDASPQDEVPGRFENGIFVPTEEIRVDSAIAFPVDI